MTIALPPIGTEYTAPQGTILVTDFAAHAVMVDTLDPTTPAVPGVQLQIGGILVAAPTADPVSIMLLMEYGGAHDIMHGIENCLQMLENIRRNQEH